jgi:hypothetical protein
MVYYSSFSDYLLMSAESASKRVGMRLMNEPKNFSGDGEANGAVVWLNRMDRLRVTAKLTDEEILFVIGDHLTGKAETWWNVVGSKAKTWDEWSAAFKKHYLSDQEDKWWQQLHSLKQGKEFVSIDDVGLKMQELFYCLDNKSESFQVRTFLNAITPKIAFEIEKDGTPVKFQDAMDKAKQIEKSLRKYGSLGYTNGVIEEIDPERQFNSDRSEASAVSSMFSLVDKLEKLSINLVNLSNASGGGSSRYVAPVKANSGVAIAPRRYVCFFCDKEGHKKYDCPEYLAKSKSIGGMVATGSNTIPIEQGKGQEYQS